MSFDFKHLLYTISKRIELYTPGSFVLLSEEKNTWQEQLDIFRQQMSRFRGHRPLIILIDGIDQLADKDIIPIDWPLRLSLPSNVRIIVTTADHDQADRLGNVGWTTVEVASLDEVTKHQIIKKYLASYGKQLTERQVTCIASAPACSNPRYLVELLEELRLHSDYSTLNQRIEHYVSKESLPALYASILERIEDDFEKSNVSALIIQQFFSFLWAAPEGLTELELRILLGTPTQPLPQIYLSNFTLATERFVQNRRSVLTISDPYFREAIKQRYVSTFEEQQALFCKITIYIQTEEIDFRRLNLLCHCLFGAREWDKLVDLLKDHKTLLLFWKYGKSQLVLYWNRLYNDGNINAKEIYNWNKTSFNPPEEIAIILNWLRNELSSSDIPSSKGFIIPDTPEPKRNTGLAKIISYCNLLWYSIYSPITNIPLKSKYLFELGRDQEAFILIDKFILHPKNFLGSAESVEAYNCIAGILSSFGYNGKAITMLKRGEEIAEECGDIENLPLLYELYMIIIIYYFDNLNDDTEFEYRKNVILEIHNYAKRINNPELLQLCWGTIGDYYRNMKEWKSALEHYHFEEEVCRNHDLSEGLIYAMSEQGDIYYSQEEYEKAFSFFNDAAKICRSLHYNDKLALLMLQMGDSLLLMGELERAEQRYKISLKVYREINENDYECYLLDQLGTIYELSEDLPHALQLWHEEEQLAVDKGDTDSYHDSLQQQLRVYKILDDKIGIQRCENALSQANNQ